MSKERIHTIKTFIEERGEEPFLVFALANEYLKLGNSEKALEAFEKLRINHKQYTGFYYHYVQLLMNEMRYEEAKAVFEQGVQYCQSESQHHDLAELQALGIDLEDFLD